MALRIIKLLLKQIVLKYVFFGEQNGRGRGVELESMRKKIDLFASSG
jgi:hypothetical protein